MGGAMAAATDEAGIQFRILNRSKGPAVRATRAQADRVLYRRALRGRLETQSNLALFQQPVDDLLLEGGRVTGAVTQAGIRFRARAVVLTAGDFPQRPDACRAHTLPGGARGGSAGTVARGAAAGAQMPGKVD